MTKHPFLKLLLLSVSWSRKYPDKAKELCRQVVYRFDWYDTDIKAFREKRKEILELLSQ